MHLPNKLSKIILFLAVLTGSLWTGAYLIRLLLTYQIFEGTDLHFREYITAENLNGIYNVLNPAIASTFFFYTLFLIFFLVFLLVSKVSLKKHGWLFIITIIVLVTAPFEIYLMTLDYDILMELNNGGTNTGLISDLLTKRIKVLGSFPLIETLSYFSFYYLILFKPLTANEN